MPQVGRILNNYFHLLPKSFDGRLVGRGGGQQPRTAVDHADVIGDLLHLVDAVLISQDRLELVFCSNDDTIGSWNKTNDS